MLRFPLPALFFLLLLNSCSRSERAVEPAKIRFPDAGTAPDSILEAARAFEAKAPKDPSTETIVAHIFKGMYFERKGSYRQARKEFNTALQGSNVLGERRFRFRIYLNLGNTSKNLAEYPEALNYYSKALPFVAGDSELVSGIHSCIAQVFQIQGDLPQAILHLQVARRSAGSETGSHSDLLNLHTLANVYGMSGKTDSALALDEEGLALARRTGNRDLESSFIDNKANCYLYSGRLDSARILFHQSMTVDSALGNQKLLADTWMNLGYVELEAGNQPTARRNLERGIGLATASGYRNGAMNGWRALVACHEAAGDYKAALRAQQQYEALKDSVQGSARQEAVTEWKAVYETQRKEEEIRLQALQLRQKNLTLWFVSIAGLLLASAVYYASRRAKERKEKRYQEILRTRDQESVVQILQAEETERRRIAADLHDGIGQILTAAGLNLQAVQPAAAALGREDAALLQTTLDLIGDSTTEIRHISRNMIPSALSRKGLLPALQEMVSRISDSRLRISLATGDGDVVLENKTAELIVYRIVQECVSNVVRHAQADELYISLTHDPGELAVMIEDNGTGFSEAALADGPGIGIQNIRSRVQYLQGTVEWNSTPGQRGTVVAIHIPLPHAPTA